jgi:hypothetical protein
MSLKKPSLMQTAAAGCDVVPVEGGLPGFPLLWEFLSSGVYGDGMKRQLPTLMVFLHDGRLTLALNDRDNSRTAFVSGSTVPEALTALEGGLEGDSLGWRPNKPQGKSKGR